MTGFPCILCAGEQEYIMEEITVTSSRKETQVFQVPDAIGVVKSSDIEEKNARTLPDALSFESNVHMQKTNHAGGSPFIRGMTGKDVLILIDGVRFNNSTFRYGPNQYLNTIEPSMVDRVEIVRGPGSVMYGSDALGGVINIITKKPSVEDNRKVYSSLTSRFGSQDKSFFNRLDAGRRNWCCPPERRSDNKEISGSERRPGYRNTTSYRL
jgi:outer membrane cobalamin receptor